MSNTNEEYLFDAPSTEQEMEDFLRQGEIFLEETQKESGIDTSLPDELFKKDQSKSFYLGMFAALVTQRSSLMMQINAIREANRQPSPEFLLLEINLVAIMCSVAKLCLKTKSKVLFMTKNDGDVN